jgi:2-polyprenyl-6-methoxyphenol hydroxylase-like FAD-dependent oxidoreductase
MTARKKFHVVIVGGSLVGLSIAVALEKVGMHITCSSARVPACTRAAGD